MRIILTAVLALLIAGLCPAQEDVFTDDFDAGLATGWTAVSGGSDWRVREGSYVFDGGGWGRYRTLSPVAIVDGAISFVATPLGESVHQPPWATFGVVIKYVNGANFVIVRFGAYNGISVMQWREGERTIASIGTLDAEVGREYQVRVEVEGDQLRTFLDGEELDTMTIGMSGEPGRVGFYTETPAAFDDFRVEGAVEPPAGPGDNITGTPKLGLEFAAFQPDPLLPHEVLPTRGRLHLYLRNTGDDAAILQGASLDGVDAAELVRSGRVVWADQSPHRIEPGEVGRVTMRLQAISEAQAEALMADPEAGLRAVVQLRHRNAEPFVTEAVFDGRGEPLQINMLTFGPQLRTVHAYLQANWPEGASYDLTRVEVNGRDVTDATEFASRTVGADVVPLRISLDEPLVWGRHVTVTIATEQGASCGHTLRAFPSEFPIQVCLFDQVRDDTFEDISNHCFTCVGARRDEDREGMAEFGLDQFLYGGGLGKIMQCTRPDQPRVVAFWNDEWDEHPVDETIARLDEAHAAFRAEGKFIPPQMVNLVGPWNASGIGFMDIIDMSCHGYGMAGASNGRDFPLISSLPWRETRIGRRPFWPYFRNAELSMSVNPETREVIELAPATQRVIEPAQERFMTYGCLQLGAKGVCHWAYGVYGGDSPVYYVKGPGLRLAMGGVPWPVTDVVRGYKIPEEILRSLKDTWDEIGRINAELQTIGPWVANSDVSPGIARVIGDTPAQAVALVSGLDTVVLIALNLSIDTDWSGKDPVGIKSYDPVDATVRLDLPEWLAPTDVFAVDHEGLTDLSPTRDGRSLVFDLPGLAVQEIIVVTENAEVRARMQAINAEMRDRLQRMATHVPVPKVD
jgi:hypothetical protein